MFFCVCIVSGQVQPDITLTNSDNMTPGKQWRLLSQHPVTVTLTKNVDRDKQGKALISPPNKKLW